MTASVELLSSKGSGNEVTSIALEGVFSQAAFLLELQGEIAISRTTKRKGMASRNRKCEINRR